MNNEATSICALCDECNQVLFAIFHKHLRNDNCQAERKRGAHFQGANNECHPRFSIKRQVDLIVIIIVVVGAESVHWLTSRALVRRRETMREGGRYGTREGGRRRSRSSLLARTSYVHWTARESDAVRWRADTYSDRRSRRQHCWDIILRVFLGGQTGREGRTASRRRRVTQPLYFV